MTTTKSPARIYGESVLPEVIIKNIAATLAATFVRHNVNPDSVLPGEDTDEADEVPTFAQKMVMLEAGQLLFLRSVTKDGFPMTAMVWGVLLPPILDSGKLDDCAKPGAEGATERRNIRRIIRVGSDMLRQLIGVYCHELSHAAVAKSFGADSEVSVIVMPEMRDLGDMGYGVSLDILGGRCKLLGPLTPEQRAATAVAGYMGELLCPSFSSMGDTPAKDANFWLKVFADIHAKGEPKDGDAEKTEHTFHDGSWRDAADFYENAPTEELRRAAVLKAGEILFAEWGDILAASSYKALRHMTTMGHVMHVMTTAMDMAEAAAGGNYGEAVVTSREAE